MKLMLSKSTLLKKQLIVHFVCIAVLISLCVSVPVLYSLTGKPSHWAIILIFSIPCAIYLILVFVLYTFKQKESNRDVQHESEETIRIQTEEDAADVVSSIDTSSYYNPSTTGIPPSSFLAPTVHQQPSIRSSSLEYSMNPPPPVYQETFYPPSYRSTNSTKDDRQSSSY
ncbi:hypothetical protein BD560DRAFT_408386 [Blakeslea trispora]|nr:hypothetical protein BD560DRAFT_408386 [Blakeslea trispora]